MLNARRYPPAGQTLVPANNGTLARPLHSAASHMRTILVSLLPVIAVSLPLATVPTVGQTTSSADQSVLAAPSGPHVTYDGRIFLSFPNYDIWLSRGPQAVGDLFTGLGNGNGQLIFKNSQGMRWDGENYFWHPAYRIDLVTRNYYQNRVSGGPSGLVWPPSYVPTSKWAEGIAGQYEWPGGLPSGSRFKVPAAEGLAERVPAESYTLQPWVILPPGEPTFAAPARVPGRIPLLPRPPTAFPIPHSASSYSLNDSPPMPSTRFDALGFGTEESDSPQRALELRSAASAAVPPASQLPLLPELPDLPERQ